MTTAMVEAQLDAVLADLAVQAPPRRACWPSAEIVSCSRAAAPLEQLPPLVVDPVLVTSSGRPHVRGEDVAGAYRAFSPGHRRRRPTSPRRRCSPGAESPISRHMEAAARELQASARGS